MPLHSVLVARAGLPTIDIEDWQRNTRYTQYRATDPQILWFWRVVRELKHAERALLLKFCTGSSRVPAGGFGSLFGLSGPTLFTIARVQAQAVDQGVVEGPTPHCAAAHEKNLPLPTASACFNMIKLPAYSRYDLLEEKLLVAIRHGAEGFSFS